MTYDAGNPNLDRHKNVYGEDYLSEEQNVDTFCAVHDNIWRAIIMQKPAYASQSGGRV
jgi:hypothetical protein